MGREARDGKRKGDGDGQKLRLTRLGSFDLIKMEGTNQDFAYREMLA